MELLIVRHAPAGDRLKWLAAGKNDARRPVTPQGAAKFRRAARGIKRLAVRLNVIAASPYARARRTADLLAELYPDARRASLTCLRPAFNPTALLRWLGGLPTAAAVAVVGHEPSLSEFVGLLLAGERRGLVKLKKGAAGLLEFDARPKPGAGRLAWLLQPAALRRLGR